MSVGPDEHDRQPVAAQAARRAHERNHVLPRGHRTEADHEPAWLHTESGARRREIVVGSGLAERAAHAERDHFDPARVDVQRGAEAVGDVPRGNYDRRRPAKRQLHAAPVRPVLRAPIPLAVLQRKQVVDHDHLGRSRPHRREGLDQVRHVHRSEAALQARPEPEAPGGLDRTP